MKRKGRVTKRIRSVAPAKCEGCERPVRYDHMNMRYNAVTGTIRTPSGLVIKIRRR